MFADNRDVLARRVDSRQSRSKSWQNALQSRVTSDLTLYSCDRSLSPASSPKQLFADYAPPAGVFDEAVASNGQFRQAWKPLLQQLSEMGIDRLRNRWNQAQAQIERNGITYNPYEDDGLVSRPWALDAIPMVLAESEWQAVTARLGQRARVLNALLQDLFGEQRTLKDRIIPPELVYGHPGWYPAYQDLHVGQQGLLTYCVTDVARDPSGQWWATGDRTRSPFGLGYVLENRITTSRMLAGIFRKTPVCRLAPFYATLKETLRAQAPRFKDNPRIVLWTKGPQSRGYFEDSYLARYLGYTLAEGDDLAVRNDRVQLLTLGGLLPVEVLLRRLDDDDCDSVELNPSSPIGISSLLNVVREGKVAVANAVGSRLVESPAFLPFLPAVSRHLLGEDLAIPSVATWWCGKPDWCQHVLSNFDRMLVRPAFRMADARPTVVRSLSIEARESLADQIRQHPERFVGQEMIDRSTTPVLTDDGVESWFVGLRTFQLQTRHGFRSLPGGLARVSPDSDSLNFTMTAGERSQDVWILSEKPVEPFSLLENSSTLLQPKRSGEELPSRVADNFFWLGRYSERAAQAARALRTLYARLESEDTDGPETLPLLRYLATQGQVDPDHVVPEFSRTISDATSSLPDSILDAERPLSLRSSVSNALRTALRVRDRISLDMWQAVDRLHDGIQDAINRSDRSTVDMADLLERSLAELAALNGLVGEGMTRTLGWSFFDLGRRLERITQTTALLRSFLASQANNGSETLEALLTVADSLMTYRNRYLSTYQVPVVLDLLMTDTSNPGSIIYQLVRINEHLDAMPGNLNQAQLNPEQKIGIRLASAIRLCDIYSLSESSESGQRRELTSLLDELDSELPKISNAVSSRFLIHAGLPRHFGSQNPKHRRTESDEERAEDRTS